jgi:hypothetical protein
MRDCGSRIIHLKGSKHPRTKFFFIFNVKNFALKKINKIN